MSLRCMLAVIERYPPDGGPGEKLLALCLADNAHDDGTNVYRGVPSMARLSLQSERTVQRQLGYMQAIGFLQLVKPAAGRSRPAIYRINPAWLKGDALTPISRGREPVDNPPERVTPTPQKGDIRSTERVTPTPQKGDTGDITNKPQRTCQGTTPLPPAGRGGSVDCGFPDLLNAYPLKRRDELRAAAVWSHLDPSQDLARVIVNAAKALSATKEWQKLDGQYAPKLSKWLRAHGWKQAPQPAVSVPASPIPELPQLTPEQRRANRDRARELIARIRRESAEAKLALKVIA